MHEHIHSVIYKEIVTESLEVTDTTAVTSAVSQLFSENLGSKSHLGERGEGSLPPSGRKLEYS